MQKLLEDLQYQFPLHFEFAATDAETPRDSYRFQWPNLGMRSSNIGPSTIECLTCGPKGSGSRMVVTQR